MRKAQKKQAEEFVALLGQAHDEIRKAVERKDIPAALSLLADCQEGAISLGELIEKTEGEDAATISVLELYCEQLYRLHGQLHQTWEELEHEETVGELHKKQIKGQTVNVNKINKTLRQSFFKIENSIKNDIKVRREVVFLPYKASMWDSLESVWRAAADDPDCDAYVIPIPYYDKKPDGSFGEMHYEASLYPEYVPVVSCEDYDIEKRRPDIIFIHNPYDDNNLVTSVQPFFYSSNLKHFTDKLVYIPYFILNEVKPDDPKALEGIKKFCMVPGVMNADKVIVQSEDMRQAYVNVLTEMSGQDMRGYWEKKILGLGSPKVDKVLGTKKEDLEIPEEWLKIICKPDGSWKKIIFYNTSVTALLEHNEKMLEKMQDVFRTFYENRDEVALLWRPHPLIRATLDSMRPRLLREYLEMVKQYMEGGWGIYDDSADLDRAITVSDGYYGDASSVVQLYQQTKKPVMLQNVNILLKEEVKLSCADIVRFNDSVYILSRDTQALFEYNTISEKVKLCGIVADNPREFFICMALYENELYIAPHEGDRFCVYNIKERKFRRIPIGKTRQGKGERRYKICFSYEKKVYFWGGKDSGTLCIDTKDDTVKEISEWNDKFKTNYGYETWVHAHTNVCIVNECFWVTLEGNNILLQYNMQTEECCFWNVGKTKMQYATVSFDGEYFWLSGDKRIIVRWKKETGEVKEYRNFPEGFECGSDKISWKDLFSCGYLWKDNIYFAPLNSNMLVKLDRKSEQMECIIKKDMDYVCFKLAEVNDREMLMEEDRAKDLICEHSFFVEKSGIYRTDTIKLGKLENSDFSILRESIAREKGIIIEKFRQYIPLFIDMLKCNSLLRTQIEQHNLGNTIFKGLV